eukprot:GGOE01027920.1.p1 GENE.GGOE01027920.1~~GGOE01027920.1.p1  ORF type:complete len:244 (+),score=71.02 GGOE01027920.1:31-732(+)
MFRLVTAGARRAAVHAVATRGLFTWGLVNHDEFRSKAVHKTRYFKENFAFLDAPAAIKSQQGRVMYSELQADLDQLVHTDWTYQFNPYWPDILASHTMAYGMLYEGQSGSTPSTILGRMTGLLPNLSGSAEEKEAIKKVIGEFKEALEWAQKSEAVYSQIFDQRFKMERAVWDTFEREKILAGLIQLYLEYFQTVPDKFKRKVCRELEYHVFSMRRMVHDCPNVKRAFPTLMA